MSSAVKLVLDHGVEGAALRQEFFASHAEKIVEIGRILAATLARGGKILFCGNGGSAADAQHLAAELVNRFQLERPPLPAIALTTDTSILTAVGNDYGFDQVFSKQIQALGVAGDALVALSTSGNSENIVLALRAAADKGVVSIGLTGAAGGEMAAFCDMLVRVPSNSTPLVQEVHIAIGHMLCRLVDYFLFEAVLELQPYIDPRFGEVNDAEAPS
jgi:D-sedoheptulose 7-phosphate isomerase